MQEHATVYQAELEAIYQACKYTDDNHDGIKPRYVKILTDSQAALKSLDSIDFKSTIALKTAEAGRSGLSTWKHQFSYDH